MMLAQQKMNRLRFLRNKLEKKKKKELEKKFKENKGLHIDNYVENILKT